MMLSTKTINGIRLSHPDHKPSALKHYYPLVKNRNKTFIKEIFHSQWSTTINPRLFDNDHQQNVQQLWNIIFK